MTETPASKPGGEFTAAFLLLRLFLGLRALLAGLEKFEAGGVYYVPKVAYAEAHAECSPGQLLTEAVLKDLCARGLSVFDFLGPQMPWKRDWTSMERVHHWLYAFAPTPRGRLAHALKFRWGPMAKEVVGWKR